MNEIANYKIRHVKKRALLAAFSETGNISESARIAKIDRHTHNGWLSDDSANGEAYRLAFADAEEAAADVLEAAARKRAVEGVEDPVFGKDGGIVGSVQRYSDVLLIFLLKGARPEKYRDRFDFRGQVGVDVTFQMIVRAFALHVAPGLNGNGSAVHGALIHDAPQNGNGKKS